MTFSLLYQIFCYISIFKQYKTKLIISLGPEKTVVMSGILLYQISLYRVSTVYFCYIMFLHVYTMQPDLPSVLNETMDLVF